jgi:7-alpha-hydroxysteroid dehydrogenase
VAREIEEAGRRAVTVPADLADLDAMPGLVETALAAFGRLDIVVNNVGGTIPNAFMDTTPEYLAEAFSFNVLTAHALTRAAVPVMLAGDGGSVVKISSVVGRVPGRGYLAYGVAKGALSHYTRIAATDLAPRIRVNAIAVGSTNTSALDFVTKDEGMRRQLEDNTLLNRIAEPSEMGAAVVYLSSPAGGYLTGKILEVDGGLDRPSLDLGLPDL